MIASLKGILECKLDNVCVVDCNGVGYEVSMPASDWARLPKVGEPVAIYTWYLGREDGVQLYGFLSQEDRSLFKTLLGISGVGPKSALAVLSGLSKSELENVVAHQDLDALCRLPGIGRKTGERLLLELKDKFKAQPLAAKITGPERDEFGTALEALLALGYSAGQARLAMQKVLDQELPPREAGRDRTAELVRLALRHL